MIWERSVVASTQKVRDYRRHLLVTHSETEVDGNHSSGVSQRNSTSPASDPFVVSLSTLCKSTMDVADDCPGHTPRGEEPPGAATGEVDSSSPVPEDAGLSPNGRWCYDVAYD